MNRSLQMLLIFSTFLLLLSGWQGLFMAVPESEPQTEKQPAFEQASLHSSPLLLAAPLQLLPFTLTKQSENFTAANPAANLHNQRGLYYSRPSISFPVSGDKISGRSSLYLLYRKLRT